MPELGYINNKEAASLIGVAPFNRESGAYQDKRMIRGRRPKIRTAMYMAIIACIRKLVIVINSMVRNGVMWDPKMI